MDKSYTNSKKHMTTASFAFLWSCQIFISEGCEIAQKANWRCPRGGKQHSACQISQLCAPQFCRHFGKRKMKTQTCIQLPRGRQRVWSQSQVRIISQESQNSISLFFYLSAFHFHKLASPFLIFMHAACFYGFDWASILNIFFVCVGFVEKGLGKIWNFCFVSKNTNYLIGVCNYPVSTSIFL